MTFIDLGDMIISVEHLISVSKNNYGNRYILSFIYTDKGSGEAIFDNIEERDEYYEKIWVALDTCKQTRWEYKAP